MICLCSFKYADQSKELLVRLTKTAQKKKLNNENKRNDLLMQLQICRLLHYFVDKTEESNHQAKLLIGTGCCRFH